MKNNISYAGKVTIKVKGKPPIKKKNSGTLVLFNTLCDILTSTNIDDNRALPAYISLIHNKDGAITSDVLKENTNYSDYLTEELVISLLPISSRKRNNDGSCIFSCLFAHSQANISKSFSADTICYIVLLDSNKQIMAFFDILYNEISPVFTNNDLQAAIEWEMSFDNKEITE